MLQAVSIKNYLSFKEQKRLQVRDGKLVVVGEDGAGKTNLFRAVKFALQSQPIRWNGESMCPWDCNDELDVSIDVDMIAEDVAILRDFITFKLFSKLIDHCKEDTGEYMDQFEAFLKDNDAFTQLRLGYRSEAFNKQYLQPFCETIIKGHYQLVSFRHNTQIDFFANCLPDDVYSKIDKDDLDKPLNFSGFYGNSYFTAKWEQRALKMQELTAGLRQTSFSLLMRKMVATRFVFFSDHIDSFLSGSESLVKAMDYAGVEKLLFEKKMSRTRQGRFEFKTIQEHMKHLANIVPDVGLTDTTSRLSVRFGESDTSTLLPRVFFTEVDGHTFDAGTASSGVARLLTILAVLHTSDYLTCFLDEPLETLHPALRHHMRDHFLTVKNKAIIMITHAGEMIVPPLLDHTYRFRTQFKNNQGSSTEVYDIKQVLRARKDIKMELINLSVESSFREIFFTRSVIFVEGINDKRVLDSLSFVIRHKKSVKLHDIKHIHWSVIAIGGKGRFPAAVHLAKNMGLEWVCLMDLDALLPDDEHIRAQLKENGSKAKQIDVTFHEYKDTLQQVLQDLNKIASKKGLPVPQNPSPIPSPSRAVATSVGTPPDLLPAPPLSPASESIASETTVSPQQSTMLLSANNNSNNQQQTNATPTITISATPNVVPEVTGEDSDLTKVIEYIKGIKSRVDISLKSVEKNRHKLEAQGDLERWNLASTHQSAAYLVIKQHFLGPNEDFFNTRNHHLDAFLNYCSERRVFSWRNGALESLFQITFPDFTKSRWSKLFYAELVELVRKLVEDDKNTEVTRLLNFLKRWNCLEMSSGPRTEL